MCIWEDGSLGATLFAPAGLTEERLKTRRDVLQQRESLTNTTSHIEMNQTDKTEYVPEFAAPWLIDVSLY